MVMHTVPGQVDGVVFHVLAILEHLHMRHLTTMIVLIRIMIIKIIVIILDYAPFCKSSSVW